MSYPIHHLVRRLADRVLLLIVGLAIVSEPVLGQAGLDKDPDRIVTLGGSITEIVFALGLGSNVVAVDGSSVYPESVSELPQLGYFRATSAEGVLSMNPSLVLARDDAGPAVSLDQIRSTGIPVILIPVKYSAEGAREKITQIARATGREAAGRDLVASLDESLAAIPLPTKESDRPSVLFIYARGGGTLNVSGSGTAAEAMINLSGGTNAFSGFSGYRPLTAESVVSASPDVILMLDRGLESVGGIDGLLGLPGIALTPAGRARRVISMDDALFLSFGPRLGQAVIELHTLLNPVSN